MEGSWVGGGREAAAVSDVYPDPHVEFFSIGSQLLVLTIPCVPCDMADLCLYYRSSAAHFPRAFFDVW